MPLIILGDNRESNRITKRHLASAWKLKRKFIERPIRITRNFEVSIRTLQWRFKNYTRQELNGALLKTFHP